MAITVQQFTEALIQSGLVTAADVAAFQKKFAPHHRPEDVQTLARALVKAGRLTKYQAAAIYQGNAKGLVFDEYVVLDKLGQGGMGIVFKAKHRRMDRLVAIKMLPRAAMNAPENVQRFYREVQAAAKLTHPNIVAAYDAREFAGAHCLVMEYVEGQDLAHLVHNRGPLPVSEAVECILQAARGLQYAHEQGIVHRDIKPGNLLLDQKGTVKILDMGLARMIGAEALMGGPERLTTTGQVMGTCDYMAPEQAEDTHKADHRADIYSLGCTLYKLLTGGALYTGQTLIQILLAHREAAIPSLSAVRPDVPPPVDAIFRKMVAKRAAERQQSMAEVVADLEAFLRPRPAPVMARLAEDPLGAGMAQSLAFLKDQTPAALAAKPRRAKVGHETLQSVVREETGTGILTKARLAVAAVRAKPRMLAAVAGGAATLLLVLGLVFSLAGGKRPANGSGESAKEVTQAEEVKQGAVSPTPPEAAAKPPAQPIPRNVVLDFDGEKDFIQTNVLYDGRTPITVEAVAKAKRPGAGMVLGNINQCGVSIGWEATRCYVSVHDGTGYRSAGTEGPLPTDAWFHLAGVFDGQNVRFYVDGKSQGSPGRMQGPHNPAPWPFMIAADPKGGPEPEHFFAGQIREVRISFAALYDKDFTPAERLSKHDSTVLLLHLDEGQGDIAYDSSGKGNDCKISGARWMIRDGDKESVVPAVAVSAQPQGVRSPPLAVAPFDADTARKHQEAWAKHLGVPVETTNSIGMKFVLIPPGEFDMGSTQEEVDGVLKLGRERLEPNSQLESHAPAGMPRHRVRLTEPYLLGATEVTVGTFRRFVDETGYKTDAEKDGKGGGVFDDSSASLVRKPEWIWRTPGFPLTDEHPVTQVSWNDAVAFCQWLSTKEGKTCRLPTEAEWEYACRAGTQTLWCNGDDPERLAEVGNVFDASTTATFPRHAKAAISASDSYVFAAPVAQFKHNAFGLYDMHGNVFEWCADRYDAGYYGRSPSSDPLCHDSGNSPVCRGGSSCHCVLYSYSAYRGSGGALDARSFVLGFRVAMNVAPGTAPTKVEEPAPAPADRTDDLATLPNGWRVGKPVALGPTVNSDTWDTAPATSSDGLTLLFSSDRPGGQGKADLWQCSRTAQDRPFGEPVNLGPVVNGSEPDSDPWLTPDGLTLFFNSERPEGQGGGDLWMSRRASPSDSFGAPVNLGPGINSPEMDGGPSLSADGLILVFHSKRPGGQGGADLWMCSRASPSDPFGKPVHLGPVVNSSAAESGPHLSPEGLTLLFCSDRPGGEGRHDLWMSHRTSRSDPFGEPVNLGPTINTSSDEGGPAVSSDGRTLFFHSDRPGSRGPMDLWMAPMVLPQTADTPAPKASASSAETSRQSPPPAVAPFDARKAKEHQEAWAKHLGVPVETTNSIGMKMVLLPPGEFDMGSTLEDISQAIEEAKVDNDHWIRVQYASTEGPRHRVRITKAFYLGMYEVTQGEYEKVMGVNPSTFTTRQIEVSRFEPPLHPDDTNERAEGIQNIAGKDTSRHPVEIVSWDEAKTFCEKLTAMPQERAAGRNYRLPTEAQWEYACRAGTTMHWGRDGTRALGDSAWYKENSDGRTHPVGERRPNDFGLFDMRGNVWEWCADCYAGDWYGSSPTDDPTGPVSSSDHVRRGGSWRDPPWFCRSAGRYGTKVDRRHNRLGLRIACAVPVRGTSPREATPAATAPAIATTVAAVPPPAVAPFDAATARKHQEAWAKHLGVPVERTNSIGMKAVLVPPGEFEMGTTPEEVEQVLKLGVERISAPLHKAWLESHAPGEKPRHRVRLTRPFFLGATEVTVGAFRQFVSGTGYKTDAEKSGKGGRIYGDDSVWRQKPELTWRNPGFSQSDEHPVMQVSWNDAVAFCQWLGAKEGTACRLPTEAEWEYACRAGTETLWCNGNDPDRVAEVGNLLDASAKADFPTHGRIASSTSDSYPYTAPVRRFRCNAFGLYDMHGNAFEWCNDHYHPGYYAKSPLHDPPGPDSGQSRVCRGGSWLHNVLFSYSAFREGPDTPDSQACTTGFRVAWTIPTP